jgi:hypothetical protein
MVKVGTFAISEVSLSYFLLCGLGASLVFGG